MITQNLWMSPYEVLERRYFIGIEFVVIFHSSKLGSMPFDNSCVYKQYYRAHHIVSKYRR